MTSLIDYLTLKGRIEKLEGDSALLKERAFVSEFIALKDRYDFTPDEVLRLLKPEESFAMIETADSIYQLLETNIEAGGAARSTAKSLRRYKNPHTGETVETRGSNHNKLKEWRKRYGAETVVSWREL